MQNVEVLNAVLFFLKFEIIMLSFWLIFIVCWTIWCFAVPKKNRIGG